MTSPETVASERKRARKETVTVTVRRDMFGLFSGESGDVDKKYLWIG